MNSTTNQSIENSKDKMIRENEKRLKHEAQKAQTDSSMMKGIRDMQIHHNEKVIYKKGQDLAAQRADLSDRIESDQALPDIEHNTSRLQPKAVLNRPLEGCGCGKNGGVSAEMVRLDTGLIIMPTAARRKCNLKMPQMNRIIWKHRKNLKDFETV